MLQSCLVTSRLASDGGALRGAYLLSPPARDFGSTPTATSGRVEFSGNCGTLSFSGGGEGTPEAPTLKNRLLYIQTT